MNRPSATPGAAYRSFVPGEAVRSTELNGRHTGLQRLLSAYAAGGEKFEEPAMFNPFGWERWIDDPPMEQVQSHFQCLIML
jgi:hypothetical protein